MQNNHTPSLHRTIAWLLALPLLFVACELDASACTSLPDSTLTLLETRPEMPRGIDSEHATSNNVSQHGGVMNVAAYSKPGDAAPQHAFAQRAETAVGLVIGCSSTGVALRVDIGMSRDVHEPHSHFSRFARLVAGAPFAFGTLHAGAMQDDARSRTYYGGAVVQTDFRPIALEARWQNREGIWQTLLSAGLNLFTTETMELGVGFVQLEDNEELQRRLMLKLRGEF